MDLTEEQFITLRFIEIDLEKWRNGELNEMPDRWKLMLRFEQIGKWLVEKEISDELINGLFPLQDLKDFACEFLHRLGKEVETPPNP